MMSKPAAFSGPHAPSTPRRVGRGRNSFLPASMLAAGPLSGLSKSQHSGLWLVPSLPFFNGVRTHQSPALG